MYGLTSATVRRKGRSSSGNSKRTVRKMPHLARARARARARIRVRVRVRLRMRKMPHRASAASGSAWA